MTASSRTGSMAAATTAIGPGIDGSRAGQQSRQHVPALEVKAEQVAADRPDPRQAQVRQVGVVRCKQRAE